jgi:hypothetical protein
MSSTYVLRPVRSHRYARNEPVSMPTSIHVLVLIFSSLLTIAKEILDFGESKPGKAFTN